MAEDLLQKVVQSTIDIGDRLSQWTGGTKPILNKVIKICGWSAIAFGVTQFMRRIWYTAYHKYKKYPPGPIGLPVFGCFFNLLDFPSFEMWIGSAYYPISMYPIGTKTYSVKVSDMKIANQLFKLPEFSNRPALMVPDYPNIPPHFGNINGKEWSNRRKLFYNSILKITDSEFMTKYVQNNIKNKIIIPSIERAIKNNDGLWNPKEACFHYTFSTIFGASFGPNVVLSQDDSMYKEFQKRTQKALSKLVWFVVLPLFSWTATKILHKVVKKELVEQREILENWIKFDQNETNSDESYIDMMMNANIDREVAISDILLTFKVGTHTTAESIQLMIYTLTKYPNVQSKIYEELRQIFGMAE